MHLNDHPNIVADYDPDNPRTVRKVAVHDRMISEDARFIRVGDTVTVQNYTPTGENVMDSGVFYMDVPCRVDAIAPEIDDDADAYKVCLTVTPTCELDDPSHVATIETNLWDLRPEGY